MVKYELDKLSIAYSSIELGTVVLNHAITPELLQEFKANLFISGLVLMDDKRGILVDRIKNVIIEMVHYTDEMPDINYSDYIAEKLGYDYAYLSNLFCEIKGVTIQHFIIKHKIERAKELILYDELNLTEISYKLCYSSVAHLSAQFKKITGLTPSYYKKIGKRRTSNLENL